MDWLVERAWAHLRGCDGVLIHPSVPTSLVRDARSIGIAAPETIAPGLASFLLALAAY
jgi:hypothetical protein